MEEKTIFKKVVNTNGIYSCDELDITVEEWKKVLQDSLVYNNYKLWLARFYQEVEHKATCKYMGEKYKCSSQTPNSVITKFGIAARKILNRFEIQEADGSQTYWVIPMKKGQTVSGAFEWTMRDELVQAMEELGMTDPKDFEEKNRKLKTWQEIYDESQWIKTDWHNKYLETVNIIRENVKYIHWTEDCIYRLLKSSDNGISRVNRGQLSNEHYEMIKQNWDYYEMAFNKISNERVINHDWYYAIMEKIKELTGTKYSLIVNRAICGLLPGVITTAPGIDFFYERINLIKDVFPEIPEITENWLLDNLNFVSYCKTQVKFKEEYHASGFIFDLYDYCKSLQGDTQMPQEDTLVKKYANLLKNTKNLILTGAPGTGKTYLAKTIAKELGCKDDNIGFVQFHPSYDYTDFVEGLRPTDKGGNGNVGFERRDGVFKEFCERALKNLVDSKKSNEELKTQLSFKESFDLLCNKIQNEEIKTIELRNGVSMEISGLNDELTSIYLKTKDSTVKPYTFSLNRLIKLSEVFKSKEDLKSITNIDNAIRDVIGGCHSSGYWGILNKIYEINELSDNGIQETTKIPQKNFVFIIDEINRGEVAKIFGELFYSVDPGYRVTSDDLNAIKNGNRTITTIKTQYANLETEGNEFDKVLQKKEKDFGHFFIPENVYIIGTMNDIDRSVESMDFAFRRRFTWAEVKAEDTQYMLDIELDSVLADEAKRRMENLNNAISKIDGLNEAYHIGASYFLKLNNYSGSQEERFESLWEYHIKGILQEYLRGSGNEAKIAELKAAYDKEEEN